MKIRFAFILSFVVSFCHANAQDIDSLITSLKTDKQKADTLYYFSMQNFRKNSLDNTISLLNRGFEFANDSAIYYYHLVLKWSCLIFRGLL